MTAIYNEIEPCAAQWTRNLIAAGHVAPGVVDERSITDLAPDDVAGDGQRHFFAGIAVWSYALRLAGVPDELGVWTGSCPCQPFSSAGKGEGFDDERHLWPAWFELIRECRPPIVFGEQVASPAGRVWFDLVSSDLEGAGYAVGAANLCAGGVGAPHIRQRLYFVAHASGERLPRIGVRVFRRGPREDSSQADGGGTNRERVGNAIGVDSGRNARATSRAKAESTEFGGVDWSFSDVAVAPSDDGMADSVLTGRTEGRPIAGNGQAPWSSVHWLNCTDGKRRPIEPGIEPLAHGATARVGRLRAYGNAIVPQVAATFIQAALETVIRQEVP